MLNIFALQTARAGSKSVPDKNIMIVDGKPLYQHNFDYAKKSKYIEQVFISTDSSFIYDNTPSEHIIKRPENLCTDSAKHEDAMRHGIQYIENKTGKIVDYLVVLLGNSKGAYTEDLDKAIKFLIENPSYDSCESVSVFNMFNPYRAFKIENQTIQTVMDQQTIKAQKNLNINDKNSAGDIYFFNGSFFISKREAIINSNGMLPFTWMGNKIYPFVQNEPLMEVDAQWQTKLL